MTALRRNILANYAGQAWIALVTVVFAPLYIRVLGMEAFGLVGLMLSIQSLSFLLDFGLGGTLNREISRRIHAHDRAGSLRTLVRSCELIIWPLALAIALVIWLASSPLADDWLHPEVLTRAETAHAITLMGLAVALLWPSNFYANGLSGLERQPLLNLIQVVCATLRGAGVLAVLYWVSPTLSAFMWWYAAVGAAQSAVSAFVFWRALPAGERPRFSLDELKGARRFAGGLATISVLAVAVMQLDRVVVSFLRPLEELGYFSLALSVAAGLGRMIQPMFNALYPRYSRLVAKGEQAALVHLYHLTNQYLAIMIASVGAVLVLFSRDVIYLWTGDAALAARTAAPLAILAAGTALNGLMNLPYALQLAHGWTRLTVATNLGALILGIPFCIWAVMAYGIEGAAFMWFATNLGFVAVGIPLMHRRLMRGEMASWYVKDVLPPILASAAVTLAVRWLIPTLSRDLAGLALLAIVSGASLAAAALAAAPVRAHLSRWFGASVRRA